MREQIIEYLKRQNLGGLGLSTDLPFSDSGVSLYLQKPKTVYVDIAQTELEPILQTLGSHTISNEVQTASCFFTVDAKLQLPQYADIVNAIKGAKDAVDIGGVSNRDATTSTSYETDLLVTQIDIILTKLAK